MNDHRKTKKSFSAKILVIAVFQIFFLAKFLKILFSKMLFQQESSAESAQEAKASAIDPCKHATLPRRC
jgi:hypothetical protein